MGRNTSYDFSHIEHLIRLHSRLGEESEWPKAAARVAAFFGMPVEDLADLIGDMLDWLESRERSN